MIIDTSALAAIFFGEPDAARYVHAIEQAEASRISAVSFVELSMVIESQLGVAALRQCDVFLRRASIDIEPVSTEQAHIARQAFSDFGKGRHPAALNLGDCFAYALAKSRREPLLFKGRDFRRTDIVPAI